LFAQRCSTQHDVGDLLQVESASDGVALLQKESHLVTASEALVATHSAAEPARQQDWIQRASEQTWRVTASTGRQCKQDSDCRWHAKCAIHKQECETLAIGQMIGADVLMCILAFLIAGFSLAAGVGGGGLYVPLLMFVLSFDTRIGTALSQAMLSGGALAAFLYNCTGSHPARPERPLINYELAIIIGTGLMSGAQLGSVVHAWAPPAVSLVLLIIVLVHSAMKSIRNARKISEQEQKEAEANGSDKAAELSANVADPHAEEAWTRCRRSRNRLGFVWLLTLALVMVKGLLLPMCTPLWWAVTIGTSALLGGLCYYFSSTLSKQKPLDQHDLDFTEMAFQIARMSALAGGLAALCGIGGGMVMGPILVEMKVPPPVSSATTATTLFALASSTLLVYICRGVAPAHYAVTLSSFTFVGALTGKVLVGWWIRKTGKQSLIVWALAIVTLLSTALMGLQGVLTIFNNAHAAISFRDFCPHVSPALPRADFLMVDPD
jgi:uncharacterized membrane protein YfcA